MMPCMDVYGPPNIASKKAFGRQRTAVLVLRDRCTHMQFMRVVHDAGDRGTVTL